MDRLKKSKYLEVAEDLNKYFKGKISLAPERAFIDWYIEARFGNISNDDYLITDGKSDGGIDAVVWGEDSTYVFQMKYQNKPRLSQVKREEVFSFEKIAKLFTEDKYEEEFKSWLESVRPEIVKHYRKIHQQIRQNKKVRFIFVTTKDFTFSKTEMVEVEDFQKIFSLWDLYREGFTPPAEEITLKIDHYWHHPSEEEAYDTYIGLADMQGFIDLMEKDVNERLFAQNVRTDLRTSINKAITDTYIKEPDVFWLGNNGIYIICKGLSVSGDNFKLVYPSIINGSQTLHAIYKSGKKHRCYVLVRILVMDVLNKHKLLSKIIKRTNSQNPMKLVNLAAHDKCQLNIARYLDRYNIFYERRQNEWKNEKKDILTNFTPVKIKELAQWLSTIKNEIGLGTAYSSFSKLFGEKNYDILFSAYEDEGFSEKYYKELVYVVWSGLLIKNIYKYFPKTKQGFAKKSKFVLLAVTLQALLKNDKLFKDLSQMLSDGRYGRKNVPVKLRRLYKKLVDRFIKIQRKHQIQAENIDFRSFFIRNELAQKAYDEVSKPNTLKKIEKEISLGLEHIR